MFNIANISKVVNNLTAYFKKVGSKEFIKIPFITQYGYYTNPKDKRGLLLDNKYIIALHNHKNIPIKLDTNDIILTDGKTYIHIDFKGDNINIKMSNNLNEDIGNNKNVNIKNNSNETVSNNKNINIGNNSNETVSNDYNLQATNINLTASNTINLTAPNIKFNSHNLIFNCKIFKVNASVGIKFNSPSGTFTHNGINVGDTHVHKMKQVIWGISDTDVPH